MAHFSRISMPKLPYDVLHQVVHMIHSGSCRGWASDDERLHFIVTLSNVSIMFHNICRPYIFKVITVPYHKGIVEKSFFRMVQTLKSTPGLLPLVREIHLRHVAWDEYTSTVDFGDIQEVLCSLPRLRSLVLEGGIQWDKLHANILISALGKATLERLRIKGSFPSTAPTLGADVLSCRSLLTLEIYGNPGKWTDLPSVESAQSSPSNITRLVVSVDDCELLDCVFDLSILDYLPSLKSLNIDNAFQMLLPDPKQDSAASAGLLVPSFGLKDLTLGYSNLDHFELGDVSPFVNFPKYYSSRAQLIGVLPFAELESFSCTVVTKKDVEPLYGILERAPLLRSLTVDFTLSLDDTPPLPSSLNIPKLIQHTFLSLTTLVLQLYASCDVEDASKALHDDLRNMFLRLSGKNALEHIDLFIDMRDLSDLPNMTDLVQPFDTCLQSTAGYPNLNQLDLRYKMISDGSIEFENEIEWLEDSIEDGMAGLREREDVELLIEVVSD